MQNSQIVQKRQIGQNRQIGRITVNFGGSQQIPYSFDHVIHMHGTLDAQIYFVTLIA